MEVLEQPRRRLPIECEGVGSVRGSVELTPGSIDIFEWYLAVETRAARVPPLRPSIVIQFSVHIKHSRAEDLSVRRLPIPVKLDVFRHSLERLAQHRIVLVRSNLPVEEGRDRRVEGCKL